MTVRLAIYWIQLSWLKSRHDPVRLPLTEEGLETVPTIDAPVKADSDYDMCWGVTLFPVTSPTQSRSPMAVMSPRRKRAMERSRVVGNVVRFVKSPFPYAVIGLLVAMIIMIFIDVMPIAGLICLFAMIMVVTVVLGNHCRNRHIWVEKHGHKSNSYSQEQQQSVIANTTGVVSMVPSRRNSRTNSIDSKSDGVNATGPLNINTTYAPSAVDIGDHDSEEGSLGPMTKEDRMDNLNEFFEALFNAIDYSILIIFLGLFIVVENMSSTGLPKIVWYVECVGSQLLLLLPIIQPNQVLVLLLLILRLLLLLLLLLLLPL